MHKIEITLQLVKHNKQLSCSANSAFHPFEAVSSRGGGTEGEVLYHRLSCWFCRVLTCFKTVIRTFLFVYSCKVVSE